MKVEEAIEKLKSEYPRWVELTYVDYRDCIEDCKQQDEIVKTGYLDSVDDRYDKYESIEYIIKEVFTDEEQGYIRDDDELKQSIVDWCYDNDTSNPMKQLIKNTWKVLMFYDLDYYVDECLTTEEVDEQVKWIQKFLKVKDDKAIRECVLNASYWWELCILFDWDLEDFYWEKDWKYICFDNATIGIIHRGNGSWDFEKTQLDLCLPFDRKRIYVDKAYKYSVSEIFGLRIVDDDWYNFWNKLSKDTRYTKIKMKQSEEETKLDKARKQEEFFEAEYRKWICHFEDEKFGRHTTVYVNEYPCWNRCTKCWRFFID